MNVINRAEAIRSRSDNPSLLNDIVFEHPSTIGAGFSKRNFSLNPDLTNQSRVRFRANTGEVFTSFPIHPDAVTPSSIPRIKY